MLNALIILCLLGAGALGTLTYRDLQTTRSQIRRINARNAARLSTVQRKRLELLEVRNRARLVEGTVSGGTTAIERLHQALAGTTFGLIDLLSSDEQFKASARRAKASHDKTRRDIYGALRTTNRAVHLIADTLFISKAEKRLVGRRKERNGD